MAAVEPKREPRPKTNYEVPIELIISTVKRQRKDKAALAKHPLTEEPKRGPILDAVQINTEPPTLAVLETRQIAPPQTAEIPEGLESKDAIDQIIEAFNQKPLEVRKELTTRLLGELPFEDQIDVLEDLIPPEKGATQTCISTGAEKVLEKLSLAPAQPQKTETPQEGWIECKSISGFWRFHPKVNLQATLDAINKHKIRITTSGNEIIVIPHRGQAQKFDRLSGAGRVWTAVDEFCQDMKALKKEHQTGSEKFLNMEQFYGQRLMAQLRPN